jgi:hypothetical protein
MNRFVPAALFCLCAAAPITSAWAQFEGNGQDRAVSIRPKSGEETLGPARPAPPPALPGARAQGSAAPATKAPTDMSPNDALFDAINRGDITAARDALSRGAELNAQNILGMTPMELSVDLGRNDISFLLLSMRGEVPRSGRSTAAANADKSVAIRPTDRRATQIKTAPPSSADRAPRLFANDGGTPVPAAGFLGFDAGRAMR